MKPPSPTLLTLALTLTLTPATALLTPSPLHPRGLPGAYYTCVAEDFAGPAGCIWTSPTSRCRVQGGSGIKSLGPDRGTLCRLYKSADCSGTAVKVVGYPGVGSRLPRFASFRCGVEGEGEGEGEGEAKAKAVDAGVEAGGGGSCEKRVGHVGD